MYGGGGLGVLSRAMMIRVVAEYNALLVSFAPGLRPGEFGFDYSTFEEPL
ncbi:MAG: hypothetical protein CM1200mP8_3880 [Chloroflexota bacterium]|nr:MAG: hypothetical protein CM1200mP8_3880 [Chloroflexota bacterium]